MSNYVMSDLHGEIDIFKKMLSLINFSTEDKLYILGDILDRGESPIELFNYIKSKENIFLLMGNHEKMMLNSVYLKSSDESCFFNWLYNGGNTTFQQFSKLSEEERTAFLDELKSLEYFKFININGQDFLLCHAGIVLKSDDILKEVEREVENERILWNRQGLLKNENNSKYIIIHGHTPTNSRSWGKDGYIDFYDNERKINIDCGCGKRNQLGCLRLEDFKEFYIKFQEGE